MALSKLGQYIHGVDVRNENNLLGESDVKGISTSKCFIETKANLQNVNLSSYKVVDVGQFAYVADTSRRGEKIGLAFAEKPCIISSTYTVFEVTDNNKLDPEFLMMYFKRSEFDRYARFNSWGSARETFSWEDMCNIELEIPAIEIQKKYVAIYKGLKDNLKVYESNLEELKLTYEGYIENLRKKLPCEKIGPYIQEVNVKNVRLEFTNVQGVDSTSRFVETKAKLEGVDLSKYKVVKKGNVAYNPSRINLGSIALKKCGNCIVSPMYEIFEIIDSRKLLPEYLFLWLTRREFLRSTLFYAIGSVRDTFDLGLIKQVAIPIPNIETQKDIVEIFNAYLMRKEIVQNLKDIINNICPILIRGAIKEANEE